MKEQSISNASVKYKSYIVLCSNTPTAQCSSNSGKKHK